MPHEVLIKPSAEKALDRLPSNARARILHILDRLRGNPRPAGSVKLAGTKDLWRLRVGSYRVIYAIEDDLLLVWVLRIAHRKDVYRGL